MYGLPKAIACTIVVVTNQMSTHLLCVCVVVVAHGQFEGIQCS